MAFDAHKNLAIATVATAPSPPTSGTAVTLATGEGARFPAAPFQATVWPATALPTPVTAEVVRVTARSGDVLTITRAQETTGARSIVAGDLLAATITAKTLTDLEAGTNFPTLRSAANVYEQGRADAMGHWTDVPFAAANFSTPTAGATWTVTGQVAYTYTRVGNTATVVLVIRDSASSVTGAPLRFYVALPAAARPARETGGVYYYTCGGVHGTGLCLLSLGATYLDLLRDVMGTAFPAGNLYLYVTVTFPCLPGVLLDLAADETP